MHIESITAQIKPGDPQPDRHQDYAQVTITLAGGEPVTIVVHQSQCYANTINVEIDGDLTTDDPALRINLNDNLIYDSALNPAALRDRRRGSDPGE